MSLAILKKISKNSNNYAELENNIRNLSKEDLCSFNALFFKPLSELEKTADKSEKEAIQKILNFIPFNAQEQKIYTVDTKEIIAGGVRMFLVLFTCVVGISLGLTNYPILSVIFDVATTTSVSLCSVIAGVGTGYLFHYGLKADTEKAARELRYYKLNVLASEQMIALLDSEITEKHQLYNIETDPSKSYAANLIKKPAANDPAQEVDTVDLEEVSTDKQPLLQQQKLSSQSKIAPPSFIEWFKENKYSTISNTMGVTIGAFAGSLVIPGLLVGIGKGITVAGIMLPIITGPVGIAVTLSVFAVCSLIIGALYVYSTYKNGQRQSLVTQTKQIAADNNATIAALSQHHDDINNSIILKLGSVKPNTHNRTEASLNYGDFTNFTQYGQILGNKQDLRQRNPQHSGSDQKNNYTPK